MLLVTCTRYLPLDVRENDAIFALFAIADDSFDYDISKLYDIEMLDLE